MKFIKTYLVEVRIWQWAKNILVFAPLIFSIKALNLVDFNNTLLTFFAVSLGASFVYVINDISDVKDDRLHPKKKERPIASGRIKNGEAYILALVLLFLSSLTAYFAKPLVLAFVVAYILSNILYTKILKHYPIVDILTVSVFYLFRVYIGGIAINTLPSGWLLLTTFFISLFMIAGKRRAELVTSNGSYSRKVLNNYNEKFLDSTVVISLTLFLVFYSLYSIFVHDRFFSLSIFFVFFVILRYLYLIFSINEGEEPEKLIFSDPLIVISGICAFVIIFASLYFDVGKYIKL